MKKSHLLSIACASVFSMISLSTHATLLQFDISAQNNSGNSALNLIVPDGGIVTYSLVLDIADNVLATDSPYDLPANGAMTRDNSGPQSYNFLTGDKGSIYSANQTIDMSGQGSDQIFGTATLKSTLFKVFVGMDPSTSTSSLNACCSVGRFQIFI